MRNIFSSGFNMPPGVSTRDIPGNDAPEDCDVCGLDVDSCLCPECKVCGGVGDPACYTDHGLTRTPEQIFNRAQTDAEIENEARSDAEYLEAQAERYRLEREAGGDI